MTNTDYQSLIKEYITHSIENLVGCHSYSNRAVV